MVRGARGGAGQSPRRQVDLTGIVSVAEKNDLLALVGDITENMLKNITSVFESPALAPLQELTDGSCHPNCMTQALQTHRRNQERNRQDGKKVNSAAKASRPGTANSARPESKSTSPQLAELRKESVLFFNKWQTTLTQRLKEITILSPPVRSTDSAIGRSRGGRGGLRTRGGKTNVPLVAARVDQATFAKGMIPYCSPELENYANTRTGPLVAPNSPVDSALARRYPPTPNPLWTMPLQKRKLYHHIVFLVLLSLNEYTANSHILLSNLASSLNLPSELCRIDETRVARGLAQAALEIPPEVAIAQKEENKNTKKWKYHMNSTNSSSRLAPSLAGVGIGTAHGGYGLTPLAAASLLGSLSDNGLAIGALFGFNPSKPLEEVMETFTREVQDFAFLLSTSSANVEYLNSRQVPAGHRRLRLAVTVSGFSLEDPDINNIWKQFGDHVELYTLRWELAALQNLGKSLETVTKSKAWKEAKEVISNESGKLIKAEAFTDEDANFLLVFNTLLNASWPVGLLKISKIVDNPWSVGMVRADKAGAALADAIMRHKIQGDRPVSLFGYSLGARVIYSCLMILAERRQFGTIECVVLMGTPAPAESRVWLTMKSVVSGRLVNVYSEQDYQLGFLYRTSNIHYGIAGLQDVQGANGVDNYRVTRLDKGHLSYMYIASQILRGLDLEDLSICVPAPEKDKRPRR